MPASRIEIVTETEDEIVERWMDDGRIYRVIYRRTGRTGSFLHDDGVASCSEFRMVEKVEE